jgi:hypothetical protein
MWKSVDKEIEKTITTKGTKEHKGEIEAWRRPEMPGSGFTPDRVFSSARDFSFVPPRVFCEGDYFTSSSSTFSAC